MSGPSSRATKIVVIVVGVFAVLLAALDRGGVLFAEYETAKTIQQSQHLPNRPDVHIAGVPFLTQLAEGEFDEVTVDAQGFPIHTHGRTLRLASMHVVLRTVDASRTFDSFTTKTATADALITLADLGRTLGATLKYAGNGRVQGSKSLTVAGQRLSAAITTTPNLVGQSLALDDVQVQVPGPLSGIATPIVQKLLGRPIPLTGIPFRLRLQRLRVNRTGIHVHLRGTNISYAN